MKSAIIGWSLWFLLFMTNISLAQNVSVEYDKGNDFSAYKTYCYINGTPARNKLINQRIVEGIDAQLAAKGLQKIAASDNPDLVVVYHAGTDQLTKPNTADLDAWVNGTWWYGLGGTSTKALDKIPVGHLIIDICDVKNRKYIWHAIAHSTLNDDSLEKLEKTLSQALTQMFEKYPSPPSKKQ
ncbi:MAG: DUF4136 domain-containing protein [Acidobacteria bacterium]|nr:DUF4136 domain-containing protein [Acidobacteriota bacterium]